MPNTLDTATAPDTGGGKRQRKGKKGDDSSRVGDIIAAVAEKVGVPAEAALAGGYYESKLNPQAKGDRGYINNGVFTPDASGPPHSFGIYQLFDLGKGAGLSIAARMDVYTNAMRAIPDMAKAKQANPSATWGQAFAASQRPADQAAEASAVDSYIAGYHAHGGGDPVAYFASLPGSFAGVKVNDAYSGPSTGGARGGLPGQGGGGHGGDTSGSLTPPPASDWITALDEAMSPKLGLNPVKDIGEVLKFVTVRGGLVLVGIVMLGSGLLLMFGRDIFGAAVTALVPEAKVAGAASGAVRTAGKAATVAKTAATVEA